MNEEDVKKDRQTLQQQTEHVVNLSLKHILDPNDLFTFIQQKVRNKGFNLAEEEPLVDSGIVLKVSPHLFKRIEAIENMRQARDKIREHIQILESEKAHLELQKRQLPAQKEKELQQEKDKFDAMRLPGGKRVQSSSSF